MAPDAPAACALSALTLNPQVPRCISAMPPTGKPAKSAASQPLELELGTGPGGSTTSTGTSAPTDWPMNVGTKPLRLKSRLFA